MKITVSVSEMMVESGVMFGTSGARGLVQSLTDRVCFTYTCAFLQHLSEIGQFEPGRKVAIAGDLRPSTPRILAACAAAIRHMGGEVVNCGFVPSPAVAGYAFAKQFPSLMVTGSHIPADRNGIKFNRIDGEVLKPDEVAMRAQEVALPDLFDDEGMLAHAEDCGPLIDVEAKYIARYFDFFGPEALKGLKLGVYQHSAVGRDILAAIVESLGGEAVRLGRSEVFIPVDTEAVRSEDQVLARDWAAALGLDAILSTDGDSDRPLLADENGTFLRGDILGILCARALGISTVVTPVSSNSALELSGLFTDVTRTRIGSPFVIQAMNALIANGAMACGYEANGGFLLGTAVWREGVELAPLPTRDSVLPMIAVLADARAQGVVLSALQASLPSRYTVSGRLSDYPTSFSEALLLELLEGTRESVLARLSDKFGSIAGRAHDFDTTDGLRITFCGGDVIHLRPSGNAPELRCYTECSSQERSEAINKQVLNMIAASA